MLVEPGKALSLAPPADDHAQVIEVDPGDRLLMLWGRCPAALRRPVGNPETIDELLARRSA